MIESRVLAASFLPRELDVRLIGIKSNVLPHESSVHDVRVRKQALPMSYRNEGSGDIFAVGGDGCL